MQLPQIATLCAIALANSACNPSGPATKSATEMVNPASLQCINAGGKLTIKRSPHSKFGMCKLLLG